MQACGEKIDYIFSLSKYWEGFLLREEMGTVTIFVASQTLVRRCPFFQPGRIFITPRFLDFYCPCPFFP